MQSFAVDQVLFSVVCQQVARFQKTSATDRTFFGSMKLITLFCQVKKWRFVHFGAICTHLVHFWAHLHNLLKPATLLSSTPPLVLSTFFKLYKWYRIAQSVANNVVMLSTGYAEVIVKTSQFFRYYYKLFSVAFFFHLIASRQTNMENFSILVQNSIMNYLIKKKQCISICVCKFVYIYMYVTYVYIIYSTASVLQSFLFPTKKMIL